MHRHKSIRRRMQRGSFALALIAILLLASCVQPTPDPEAVARALVSIWATQTAEAPTLQPTFTPEIAPAVTEATATATVEPPTATVEPVAATPTTAAATAEPAATLTPTRAATPAATPPNCDIAVSSELIEGWDAALGCPTAPVTTTWAAWQPFDHGALFWRQDLNWTYVLYLKNGTDMSTGSWKTGGDDWRWDDSFPEGHGLQPPAAHVEPIRGFGYVWFNFLGGSESTLGWGTDEEKGVCVTLQPFETGLLFRTNKTQFCEYQYYNRAAEPGFSPLFFTLYEDGTWQRH